MALPLLIINPNTTESMTHGLEELLKPYNIVPVSHAWPLSLAMICSTLADLCSPAHCPAADLFHGAQY